MQIYFGSTTPTSTVGTAILRPDDLPLNLLCLWLLWTLGWGVVKLWENRRTVRRQRLGLCLNCGYNLAGLNTGS